MTNVSLTTTASPNFPCSTFCHGLNIYDSAFSTPKQYLIYNATKCITSPEIIPYAEECPIQFKCFSQALLNAEVAGYGGRDLRYPRWLVNFDRESKVSF